MKAPPAQCVGLLYPGPSNPGRSQTGPSQPVDTSGTAPKGGKGGKAGAGTSASPGSASGMAPKAGKGGKKAGAGPGSASGMAPKGGKAGKGGKVAAAGARPQPMARPTLPTPPPQATAIPGLLNVEALPLFTTEELIRELDARGYDVRVRIEHSD